jgi:DNA methylase
VRLFGGRAYLECRRRTRFRQDSWLSRPASALSIGVRSGDHYPRSPVRAHDRWYSRGAMCPTSSARIVPAAMTSVDDFRSQEWAHTHAPYNRLPERWRRAPRRWGHPLHSLCSYFAMFPPQVPAVFIQWLSNAGDTVYDPFSGRGTVALEAARTGRIAFAADANPLAVALSQAKVWIPTSLATLAALDRLETRYRRPSVRGVPSDIAMLYSRRTLEKVVYLRDELRGDDAETRLLRAMTLGLLHGNHSRSGATRGFSVSMPNTFAMAPNYVRAYIDRENLVAPDVDVFGLLRSRLSRLSLPASEVRAGEAWLSDAAAPSGSTSSLSADLVFTSPPYLEVIKYAKYNWVRLWFMREDPRSVDEHLMASGSLSKYLDFMGSVMRHLATATRKDGVVCLVIGDVRRGETQLNLARELWAAVARPQGWLLHGVVNDTLPARHKVSRIWKGNEGRATKTDRVLVLSPPGSARELPPTPRITWQPPTWTTA